MDRISRSLVAAACAAACFASSAPIARADVQYFTPPKFNHKVLPIYPDAARAAHETGTVLIKVLVGADGKPKQFILFKSSGHKDLDSAVLTAAKASTYVPAMRGSTPTLAFYDVTYKFTLTGVAEDVGNMGDLSKKLETNPKDVPTRLALGSAYLTQKNYGQAEQLFKTGTELVPSNAKLWAYLGLSYYQDAQSTNDPASAKYKPSVDAFDQALKLDPHVETSNVAANAYFSYGFHLQQSNDFANALTYAQKAIALAPKGEFYILLGEVQTAQGNFADAIGSLKKAESLDDKKNSTVTSRIVADEADAELMSGDKNNGMADIARAEQVNGQAPFAYEYLFSWYVRSGNRTAAITPLNQLIQLDSKNPAWPMQLGNIYLSQNNLAAARQQFQKAAAIAPDNPDVQLGFAELAAASGDTATVASIMPKLIANADPKQASAYQTSVAIELLNAAAGKTTYWPDAQKYADAATKEDPGNPRAWYALGTAQAQQHMTDLAKISLKKAYDIFKAQNDQADMKQVSDQYKSLTGSDIGGGEASGG